MLISWIDGIIEFHYSSHIIETLKLWSRTISRDRTHGKKGSLYGSLDAGDRLWLWSVPVWGRFILPQPRPLALSRGLGVRSPPCTGHTCMSSGQKPGARLHWSCSFHFQTTLRSRKSPAPLCSCSAHTPQTSCSPSRDPTWVPCVVHFLHFIKRERKDGMCSVFCAKGKQWNRTGPGAWLMETKRGLVYGTTPVQEHLARTSRVVEGGMCIKNEF